MEELRSTEILDKEIEADARKKSERILKKAEADGSALLSNVFTRIEQFKSEKTKEYNTKISNFQICKKAVIPLERERFLVSYIEREIIDEINNYFEMIGQEKRLDIVIARWKKYNQFLDKQKVNAFVFGFDVNSAKQALEKQCIDIISCTKIEYNNSGDEIVPSLKFHEGIILETENKDIKFRLTLAQIVKELETEHRSELATTLFAGGFNEN